MNSVLISSLVVAICCLSAVNGQCCDSRLHLTFSIENGLCGEVGAIGKPDRCSAIICADGHPSVGTFCGRGTCNVFGCNCDYGCLTGNWGKSFLERNSKYTIHLMESEWKSGLLRPVNTLREILPDLPKIENIQISKYFKINLR